MIERQGDLFDTDATYIGHGANCVGVMGAGIAKTLKQFYPHNYNAYYNHCKFGKAHPGGFLVVPERRHDSYDRIFVVNFFTQDKPGPDARYEAVFTSLLNFARIATEDSKRAKYGNRIAIPEIGCGIGGLEWKAVKKLIKTVETIVPEMEFEVWHYAPSV